MSQTKRINPNYLVAGLLLTGAAGITALLLASETKAPEPQPAPQQQATQAMPQAAPQMTKGKILETMDAGGYTYARLETAAGERWVAGPMTKLEVGDEVAVPPGQAMNGFKSPSLDRTFEQLDFVSGFQTGGAMAQGGMNLPPGHPSMDGQQPGAPVEDVKVAKAENGLTIAEVYAQRGEIAGSKVVVRGKVVKVNENIMGKNWLHLRDGSGEAGSNDLTVTTQEKASLGDQVLVEGKVTLDLDLGAGYHFDVLLEEATLSVESST